MARRSASSRVFINIPFDRRNEYLYLSLIAAMLKNPPVKDVSGFKVIYRGVVALRQARVGADAFRPVAFGQLVTAARGLVSSSAGRHGH